MVVTTADPAPMHEALRFFDELAEIRIRPAAVLFNRALPLEWADAASRPARGISDSALRSELKVNLTRWGGEARRQADAQEAVAGAFGVALMTVPWLVEAPTTVPALRVLLDEAEGLEVLGLE